jgi:amino acid transporter
MSDVYVPPVPDAPRDAERLRELGYEQELRRGLRYFDSIAIGFATISPVVGLYAVAFVGMTVAGGAWLWMLPVALAGQCLLLVLYSELAADFPIANAAYQWSRRLLGPRYGWFNGWVCICGYSVANTTIAYLAAPWALVVLGLDTSANAIVVTGMLLVLVSAIVNACGLDVLRLVVKAGIGAEVIASVGVGLVLLFFYRHQDLSALFDTFGAEALSGGSTWAALLAALAVAGWVFLGFDACGVTSEETVDAARQVPKTVWVALLSVAAIVILNAFAVTLAHPQLENVVAGEDVDPIGTAVSTSFGSWSDRPFAAVTLVGFMACLIAAQGIAARAIFSIARDDVLPASRFLRSVDRRQVPIGAVVVTTVIACLGLLLGLHSAAIGSVITFGTAAIYVSFLLIATAALVARLRGTWVPSSHVQLGRAGLVLNVLAVAWLAFETVNIAWPRESLAPVGAPWYQVWAAPFVLALIGAAGLAYLVAAKPHRRLAEVVER